MIHIYIYIFGGERKRERRCVYCKRKFCRCAPVSCVFGGLMLLCLSYRITYFRAQGSEDANYHARSIAFRKGLIGVMLGYLGYVGSTLG